MISARPHASFVSRFETSSGRSRLRTPRRHEFLLAVDRPASRPTDSSLARMAWEDDGGACGPASSVSQPRGATSCRSAHRQDAWRQQVELISLPFAEYSALFAERLEALRLRLASEPSDSVRFVIVDATRVTRPGGQLLGLLHVAATRLLTSGRGLVLAGDLLGLASTSALDKLCRVTNDLDTAFEWCRDRLTDRIEVPSNSGARS